jgi:hypothetical protein
MRCAADLEHRLAASAEVAGEASAIAAGAIDRPGAGAVSRGGGQAPDQASSGRQTGAAVPPGQIIPEARDAASHPTSHKQHGNTNLATAPVDRHRCGWSKAPSRYRSSIIAFHSPTATWVDTSEPGVRAAGGEADSSSKQPAKPTHMNPSPSNALNVTRRQLQRLRHDSVKALKA